MIGLPNWLNKFRKIITGDGGGGGGGGTYTLIGHKIAFATASTTATTVAFDTTGASLLVVFVGQIAATTLSDSKGNTWTPLTAKTNGAYTGRFYYCINPTIGSGHTFSAQGTNAYPLLAVVAYSCTTTPAFDNENGAAAGSGSSQQPGSASSSGGTPVVITGWCWNDTGSIATINSSFTIEDPSRNGSTNIGIALADLIQSGGGASVNPTWTFSGGAEFNIEACIAAFK